MAERHKGIRPSAAPAARRTVRPESEVTTGVRSVTSYDVARLAGVSQSAVSRCFNPGSSVSRKMRERVMKAAETLRYQPNAIARGLITRRSNLVAVIISNLTNLYYPEVLSQLSQQLSERGIRLLLFTLEKESSIDEMLQFIWQYRVDGAIVAARLSASQIDSFKERNVPLVLYNRSYEDQPVSSVCCDQGEAARALVNRLHLAGHASFGIVAGPPDSVVGEQRTAATVRRLRDLGYDAVHVVPGNYDYESGVAAMEALVAHFGSAPDAVICANDVMALGCIDSARHAFGLEVPRDVSIAGFDGVGASAWSSYRLATVRQPVRRMAEAAVSMLVERIEDAHLPPERRVFSGIPIEGNSARLSPVTF